MSIGRLHKSDSGEPENGRVRDASLTESQMLASEAHIEDITAAVEPNHRLRNWILFANAVAWVVIIVVVRWLFF
jgi:hypothetical protein